MSSQSPPNPIDPEPGNTTDPPAANDPGGPIDDLPTVRALILAAYPDVVPDLVAGDSVTTLLASVDGARAAYAAVAERVTTQHPARDTVQSSPGAVPPMVVRHPPAGGGVPLPIDPDRLPASEKIRRGLRANPAGSSR